MREQLAAACKGTESHQQLLSERDDKLRQLEEKNEELERTNRSNENVINWLNKQLASFKNSQTNTGTDFFLFKLISL